MRKYVFWQEPDVEKLEKKINCGQIEEVIFQVGDHMAFWYMDSWKHENTPGNSNPTVGRLCTVSNRDSGW